MRMIAVAALVAVLAAPQASPAADNVLSGDLREADGTTGQNTNLGSGVKTGHLQDGAVTASKLAPAAVTGAAVADGAITAPKLAPGAVTGAAVADGAVTSSKLAPDAVTAAAVADGAVTSPKLAPGAVTGVAVADGAITASKLAAPLPAWVIAAAGLDADTVDGRHAEDLASASHAHAQYVHKEWQLVTVMADGHGDYRTLDEAIARMSTGFDTIVYVGPGRYNVSGPLEVHRGLVVGAGRAFTTIYRDVPAGDPAPWAMKLWDNSVAKGFTIMAAGAAEATVVLHGNSQTPRLEDVQVIHQPGTSAVATTAVDVTGYYGLVRDCSVQSYGQQSTALRTRYTGTVDRSELLVYSPVGRGVEAGIWGTELHHARIEGMDRSATDFAGVESRGPLRLVGTDVVAPCPGCRGLLNRGTAEVERSSLVTGGLAVQNEGTARVANTKVRGGFSSAGTLRCVGLYDADSYAPVTCP